MKKLFDLRFVIGLFFLSMGVILIGYYFLTDINLEMHLTVNKWSGLVYLIFGVVMLRLSYSSSDPNDE
nr:hypothetical protein [uncultured Sediminibacterium sp.]